MFGHSNRDVPSVPLTLIKKKIKIFLICKEIQSGAVAKSYMRKGLLIYGEMRKYFPIYEEAVRHVTGNDQDYLRKIPKVVVQKSALL